MRRHGRSRAFAENQSSNCETSFEFLFFSFEFTACPHPDPLPSDGRGGSHRHLQFCCSTVRPIPSLDLSGDGKRFSLAHRMGEGRGEGKTIFQTCKNFVFFAFLCG